MRKLIAVAIMALAALVAGPVAAADLAIPPAPPTVNTGIGGNFYLRGSAAFNEWWAPDTNYWCGDTNCGGGQALHEFTDAGYGYSFGIGFGYELGNGLRTDATLDYLSADHLKTSDGSNLDLSLRSTIALANVYYDFGLGGAPAGAGGFGAYVGAGVGAAYNTVSDYNETNDPAGSNTSLAGAAMVGVTYDMGSMVADLGYRALFLPNITNNATVGDFTVNNTVINELRGTLRYRFQ